MLSDSYKSYPEIPEIEQITKQELDPNSSLSKMLSLIGQHKKVIDFGCASGYFAKLLVDEKCAVTGVELNPDAAKMAEKYCQKVIVADLDAKKVEDVVGDERFDVAVFGDVLEHLKYPLDVLKSVKNVLTPEGFVVASIPNIAHGSVRLALLEGKFEYAELGLLDNTHLRFFTHASIQELFGDAGFCIEAEKYTFLPIFNELPFTPNLDRGNFSADLLEAVHRDRFSEVLQFVVRAYPWSMSHEYNTLRHNFEETQHHLSAANDRILQMQAELQRTQAELQQMHAELQHTQAELQQTQTNLNRSELMIQAMESSKFWQLRKVWFGCKTAVWPEKNKFLDV
jgi:2-polyprenyl-3-methyl-5-hydroxy-6-metoxy-1,4-benzoquinol methylase